MHIQLSQQQKKNLAAQNKQDRLFKSMPAGKKIHLASNFFNFARNLMEANKNGTRKVTMRLR